MGGLDIRIWVKKINGWVRVRVFGSFIYWIILEGVYDCGNFYHFQ
jgi:hypothetical protein